MRIRRHRRGAVKACGDGSIDVTERYIRLSKVPYFRGFRASEHQRRRADLTVKIALVGGLNRPFRCYRVEWPF